MNALDKAISRSEGIINTAHSTAMQLKEAGVLSGLLAQDWMGGMTTSREQGANRQRYGLFRGWLYSAINALASEGAGQPVHVGRLVGVTDVDVDEEQRSRLAITKHQQSLQKFGHLINKMPGHIRSAASHGELEHEPGNPFLQILERPNPFQHRWQFVYSFIANLNLTGWAFVLGGENEDGRLELYSLPTTWVHPNHKEGPFSRFKIRNPEDPIASDSDDDWFFRNQVDFAYLPNPSDPLSALAPATSQMLSIRIDDHIQASQERFFENGIFPSVIVTIGKDPHPDVPGGIRPRLTAHQRRQVVGAVRKVSSGVANYGNPAIVDGLIENITRMSATQNEMGWDKSEDKVRTRLLSAFGVHPYILGEPVSVGGYAQAAKIEERFCKRVNIFLDMIGSVASTFADGVQEVDKLLDNEDKVIAWWDECEPHDPEQERRWWETGVKNNHVTRDEFRSQLGLPPADPEQASRSKLLESVGGMTGAIALLERVGQGTIQSETAAQFLSLFFEISIEEARERIGVSGGPVIEEVVETLGQAIELMKQPVRISLEDNGVVASVSQAVIDMAKGTQGLLLHNTQMESKLAIEKTKKELSL